MKITFNRAELQTAVNGLSMLVCGRHTLPIIGCVKFVCEEAGSGEYITALGTDLNSSATFRGFAKTATDSAGEGVVSMAHLKRALRLTPPGASLEMSITDKVVNFKTERSRVRCFAFPPEEFPTCVTQPKGGGAVMANGFTKAFRAAMLCASSDESRAVLNGALLQDGNLVATDGRRMVSLPTEAKGLQSAIIERNAFLTRAKLEETASVLVGRVGTSTLQAFFLSTSTWHFAGRCIEGRFPDYKQVIPKEGAHTFTLKDSDAVELARMLPAMFAQQWDTPVTVKLDDEGGLSFEATHTDDGTVEMKYAAESFKTTTGGFKVSLNRNFLTEALRQGFRTWNGTDDLSPIKATKPDGACHVLMPMRIR